MNPKPPKDAPNVLVVLIDDAGFGNPDTFGGPISTPTMSRVRDRGLAYNRFHVTAICSPTRAALLTGRNRHRVGFGSIAEYPGPFPGYTAAVPKTCAPVVRTLRERLRDRRIRQVAPHPRQRAGRGRSVDRWPTGWGFDHWWGFLSVKMLFEADEPKPGTPGTVTLWANDRQIGEGRIDRTVPVTFSTCAGMDISRDNGLVVDRRYKDKAPYAFTGTVHKVVFDLKPAHPEAAQELHEHAAVHAMGHSAAG